MADAETSAPGMTPHQSELCQHGRHRGAVCLECDEVDSFLKNGLIFDPRHTWPTYTVREDGYMQLEKPAMKNSKKTEQPNGLDAEYYDLPDTVRTAQDMIEWLNLNFANGNILKSLIRENNPDAQKETTELYEAEKRFFYAERHLRRVRALQE
jgi:hypothetical protein